eukprot:g2848.t1
MLVLYILQGPGIEIKDSTSLESAPNALYIPDGQGSLNGGQDLTLWDFLSRFPFPHASIEAISFRTRELSLNQDVWLHYNLERDASQKLVKDSQGNIFAKVFLAVTPPGGMSNNTERLQNTQPVSTASNSTSSIQSSVEQPEVDANWAFFDDNSVPDHVHPKPQQNILASNPTADNRAFHPNSTDSRRQGGARRGGGFQQAEQQHQHQQRHNNMQRERGQGQRLQQHKQNQGPNRSTESSYRHRGTGNETNNFHQNNKASANNSSGVFKSFFSSVSKAAKEVIKQGKNIIEEGKKQAQDVLEATSAAGGIPTGSHNGNGSMNSGAASLRSSSMDVASGSSTTSMMSGRSMVNINGESYQVEKKIAEGGFSEVFIARATRSNKRYALKWMFAQSKEILAEIKLEISMHEKVGNHNDYIMSLLGYHIGPSRKVARSKDVLMLFPLFTEGSVASKLIAAMQSKNNNGGGGGGGLPWPYPERIALQLFQQICAGVLALHKAGFAHRDLKPHNVLLARRPQQNRTSNSIGGDCPWHAVVMDLGSCSEIEQSVISHSAAMQLQDEAAQKCTAPYRAPELTQVTKGTIIDGRVDVFSLGCILYMMAFGNNPFEPRGEFQKLALLNCRYKYPIPEPVNPNQRRSTVKPQPPYFNKYGDRGGYNARYCALIDKCLQSEPEDRITMIKLAQVMGLKPQ